jgi:hypothetical protein
MENQRADELTRRCEMAETQVPELWEWAEYY